MRLTVESPRAGFLYIIDREQYANGSMGEAMLIFPTQPLKITAGEMAGWESSGGCAERLELVGGAGRTWTSEKRSRNRKRKPPGLEWSATTDGLSGCAKAGEPLLVTA